MPSSAVAPNCSSGYALVPSPRFAEKLLVPMAYQAPAIGRISGSWC